MEAAGKGLKSFIALVLVLGLVLHVEAKSCCRSTIARQIYNTCRVQGHTQAACAKASGCKIVDGKCESPYSSLGSDEANAVEFCKLGCASSVCDSINAVGSEEASDAVDRCDEACYLFCTKNVDTTAAATTVVSS